MIITKPVVCSQIPLVLFCQERLDVVIKVSHCIHKFSFILGIIILHFFEIP